MREILDGLRSELLSERTSSGYWTGCLSPSALSTATAMSAIGAVLEHSLATSGERRNGTRGDSERLLRLGVESLRAQQNEDGGFGDTDRSHSNIATSYLVLAAVTIAERVVGYGLQRSQIERLESYIQDSGGLTALRSRYGKDKTFVVPILTNLAIAGLVPWDQVPALPFEAAVFPQSMYRQLRMPVVSYAIPALVAIGQTRHFHGRRAIFPLRWLRGASLARTMRVLRRMQPQSGGYLEATPLTSFVVMSLAVTGRGDCDVARAGLTFLAQSVDTAGSWPIDTNLATWVTSLAMQALAADPLDDGNWCDASLVRWHLSCQHRQRHPFTGAEPGGWGWSDLSGAVPDSDDTPAAMLALGHARKWVNHQLQREIDESREAGIAWLLKLQNRNGGWPTFCRGWGKLPFDRSSTDLTAHALRALAAAAHENRAGERDGAPPAARKGLAFLHATQRPDGSWVPLWFGNQDDPDELNPIYGTARVLLVGPHQLGREATQRGMDYLVRCQNQDGGWGGGSSLSAWIARGGKKSRVISSVEETAIAVEALSHNLRISGGFRSADHFTAAGEGKERILAKSGTSGGNPAYEAAIIRGIEFLLQAVSDRRHRMPWPIGFYFAKLWYHEALYPLIFTVAALGSYLTLIEPPASQSSDQGSFPPE